MTELDSLEYEDEVLVLRKDEIKVDERKELVDIFNSLPKPLKSQLLTLARVMDTTREIVLAEEGGEKQSN